MYYIELFILGSK